MIKYLIIPALLCLSQTSNAQDMTIMKMDSILHTFKDSITGGDGFWEFEIEGRNILILTNVEYNRMRIISPIVDLNSLAPEEYKKVLIANFHTALDAKYAISEDVLWSTFIHPLKELSDDQFIDAIVQVYNAANSFGTTYNSTELQFPSSKEPEERINQSPINGTKKI